MVLAYLALGSNVGNKSETLRAAIAQLAKLPQTRITAVSHFHETQPVDAPPASENFINAALAIDTQLSPHELLAALLKIESDAGRRRTPDTLRNAPRTLDLDILLYGDSIIHESALQIPHPRMPGRRFVLQPLAEIAPHVQHPLSGKTIRQLLHELGEPA